MRYSSMGSNKRNAVSVPALSGGVNLADALNLVDDNQMTDCKNVWYKDGVLQTRPGIKATEQDERIYRESRLPQYANNAIDIDGQTYKVMIFDGTPYYYKILFFPENFVPNGNEYANDTIYTILTFSDNHPTKCVVYNGKPTKENGKGVYLLASLPNETVELYELIFDTGYKFSLLTSDELYAPVVYINGKGEGYETIYSEEATYAPASFFEGYNAFTGAWARFYFTTNEASNIYRMPIDIDNSLFRIEYTNLEGEIHTTIIYRIENGVLKAYASDNNGPVDNNVDQNGNGRLTVGGNAALYFYINTKTNSFTFLNADKILGDKTMAEAIGVITNNLQITIRPINSGKSLLSGATISNEFGGVAEGIYGGTRTFLSGFSGEHKNLVVWSDLNNPTYFSENNYVYVGSNTQSVTALAKQDDMLVVFKDKELFYAKYIQGESYTAEDVIAGSVIDVTTLSAKFPVTQINDKIGCDLPNSIQLCGDRLVWADSSNHVYMLRSANQYSTANVSVISHMLGDIKLEATLNLAKEITSTTYNGFYLLKSKNKIYLLNFDQYYFNALPSYSDTKKAGRKMQWFVWEIPETSGMISAFVNNPKHPTLLVSSKSDSLYKHYVWQFSETEGKDNVYKDFVDNNGLNSEKTALPVEAFVQTKMFDFGAMERFKAIEQLYVEFGKVEGEIDLEYLTERGRLNAIAFEISGEEEENSPEFIKTKRFLPGIKRALRFGLRITAKGKVALGGILIKFRYMGVTR